MKRVNLNEIESSQQANDKLFVSSFNVIEPELNSATLTVLFRHSIFKNNGYSDYLPMRMICIFVLPMRMICIFVLPMRMICIFVLLMRMICIVVLPMRMICIFVLPIRIIK
jgi:ABC-type transport system involved in cytochrome bd biosynthesis fused ATPase/permease subunit